MTEVPSLVAAPGGLPVKGGRDKSRKQHIGGKDWPLFITSAEVSGV